MAPQTLGSLFSGTAYGLHGYSHAWRADTKPNTPPGAEALLAIVPPCIHA